MIIQVNISLKNMKKKQITSLIHAFFIIALTLISCGNNTTESNASDSNSSNQTTEKTDCIGNQSCISNVRSNFTSTNKTILNESYEGDGKFKITALDPQRGVTFNATVKTDCNCAVLDVQISDIE
jgi:uncharacterized protein (DUF2147 family)